MNRWLLGMVLGTFACSAAFFLVSQYLMPPAVTSVVEETMVVAPTEPSLPEPVVFAQVIDTADIDPLLDPPEKPITGEPFDTDPAPAALPAGSNVPARIPPAVEDSPEVTSAHPHSKRPIEAAIVGWLGSILPIN